MASDHNIDKNQRRTVRALAESEAQSDRDVDDGLDIINISRQELDLSQYIDGQPVEIHQK